MDSKVFDRLTECNAELAWQLVKDDIVTQLIGEDVLPVPFISESDHYDLYNVIIKEPASLLDRIKRKERTMWVVGELHSVTEKADPVKKAAVINEPVTGNRKLNDDYVYRVSDMRFGHRKTIEVTLKHCQHHHVDVLAQQGDIILDLDCPGLKGIRKVYIIQEVYFVTDYTIHVTVGDMKTTEFSQSRRTPIAFTFKKYALQPTGVLGTQERIEMKDKKFFWMEKKYFRSPHDPLPQIPWPKKPSDAPPVPGRRERKSEPVPGSSRDD